MPRLEDIAGQMVAGSRAQAAAPAPGPDAALPPDLLSAIGGEDPAAAAGGGDLEGAFESIEAEAEGLSPDEAAQVRAHVEAIRGIFTGEGATPPTEESSPDAGSDAAVAPDAKEGE